MTSEEKAGGEKWGIGTVGEEHSGWCVNSEQWGQKGIKGIKSPCGTSQVITLPLYEMEANGRFWVEKWHFAGSGTLKWRKCTEVSAATIMKKSNTKQTI